jgi:hypothetical protein
MTGMEDMGGFVHISMFLGLVGLGKRMLPKAGNSDVCGGSWCSVRIKTCSGHLGDLY